MTQWPVAHEGLKHFKLVGSPIILACLASLPEVRLAELLSLADLTLAGYWF